MLTQAEHSMIGHEMGTIMNVGSFVLSVINSYKLPVVGWRFENVDDIARVYFTSDVEPVGVTLWHSTTRNS